MAEVYTVLQKQNLPIVPWRERVDDKTYYAKGEFYAITDWLDDIPGVQVQIFDVNDIFVSNIFILF